MATKSLVEHVSGFWFRDLGLWKLLVWVWDLAERVGRLWIEYVERRGEERAEKKWREGKFGPLLSGFATWTSNRHQKLCIMFCYSLPSARVSCPLSRCFVYQILASLDSNHASCVLSALHSSLLTHWSHTVYSQKSMYLWSLDTPLCQRSYGSNLNTFISNALHREPMLLLESTLHRRISC